MIKLKKILVVDDNPNDVELTIEALDEQNLANRVIVLEDGVKAMDYLLYQGLFTNRERENPAVILLDIKMPRMDGIEVLKAIKSKRQLKAIPVVMLTSSREESDLKTCYDSGVNAYIVKPVNYQDFFDTVNHVGVFWAKLNELPRKEGQ